MASDNRSSGYTEDQAKAIIARALERQAPGERVTHDELVATAREIGISEADLSAAVAEEARTREEQADRDQIIAAQRAGLRAHTVAFISVNLLLLTINLLAGPPWWFLIPLFGWGIGLSLHWNAVRDPPSPRALQRARRRRERALRRDELRRSIERGSQAFEVIVEKGVGALLSHLGDRKPRIDGKHDDEQDSRRR